MGDPSSERGVPQRRYALISMIESERIVISTSTLSKARCERICFALPLPFAEERQSLPNISRLQPRIPISGIVQLRRAGTSRCNDFFFAALPPFYLSLIPCPPPIPSVISSLPSVLSFSFPSRDSYFLRSRFPTSSLFFTPSPLSPRFVVLVPSTSSDFVEY